MRLGISAPIMSSSHKPPGGHSYNRFKSKKQSGYSSRQYNRNNNGNPSNHHQQQMVMPTPAYTVLDPTTSIWSLYLPHEETSFDPESNIGQLVMYSHKFLLTQCSQKWLLSLATHESIPLHYHALRNSKCFPMDFKTLLINQPAKTLAAIAIAASMIIDNVHPNTLIAIDQFPRRRIRIFGFEKYTPLKEIKSSLLDRFVAIRTTVVRVSPIRPLVSRMEFTCGLCDTTQIIKFVDGKYVVPATCALEKCKSKYFKPNRSSEAAITVDCQKVRLQEKLFEPTSNQMQQSMYQKQQQHQKYQEKLKQIQQSYADDNTYLGENGMIQPSVQVLSTQSSNHMNNYYNNPTEMEQESGRMARTIDCELIGDSVDKVVPGDVVIVCGIVKFQTSLEDKSLSGGSGTSKNKAAQMFNIYIEANSIRKISVSIEDSSNNTKRDEESTKFDNTGLSSKHFNGLKDDGSNVIEDNKDFTVFSYKDLYCIQEIFRISDIFKALVQSLVPSIYGHELVKAGLLLALMGGRHRSVFDDNRSRRMNTGKSYLNLNNTTKKENGENQNRFNKVDSTIRAEPHVLIVGDPGLGKSQMLSAVCKLAPRGVYVSGNATTTSGLTVTMSKDPETGDTALEAGALVLSDQGICCIDEFDKMKDHHSLLEAMEQQSVSIAKAGTVCSLPARASVLAAANPRGGHYDKTKTISENLKMSPALLSRFDLIFILLDKPNEGMDKVLSDHVIKLHDGTTSFGSSIRNGLGIMQSENHDIVNSKENIFKKAKEQGISLDDPKLLEYRLRTNSMEETQKNLIPEHLLRKYLSYARRFCHPRLTKESASVLKEFYLSLRKSSFHSDSSISIGREHISPVTTRQLESLIRLSEARARCELREYISVQDARDVIALMKSSLQATLEDENGSIDPLRASLGPGVQMKRGGPTKKLLAGLHKVAVQSGNNGEFNLSEIKKIAEVLGIFSNSTELYQSIEKLNTQCFLLRKSRDEYKLTTV